MLDILVNKKNLFGIVGGRIEGGWVEKGWLVIFVLGFWFKVLGLYVDFFV